MVFKNVQKTIVLLVLKTTHFSNDNHDVKRVGILGLRTYSQCLKITAFEFCSFQIDLPGNTVRSQSSAFEKLAKLTVLGISNELLST